MAIILGGMTTVAVTMGGVTRTDGFQSVNWNIDRQPNRLWQLGSWTPWRTQVGATVSVSLTSYAEALPVLNLTPATSCQTSLAVARIVINAQTCEAPPVVTIDYASMFLNSYSYSKGDPIGFGTESWSFQRWIESGVAGQGYITIPEPTYVLQGRSEGNRSGNVGNGSTDLGIRFLADPGPAPATNYHVVVGYQGSVSAGFPGEGEANYTQIGLVDRVGGGLLQSGGRTGQSSATIPHQPLYLG